MKTPTAASSRLVKEIAVLIIMAVVVGGYFLMQGLGHKAPTTQTKPLNTTFDTDTLSQVEKKDPEFPSLVPNDLGRSDPYAP
jgi:hypothetical protein